MTVGCPTCEHLSCVCRIKATHLPTCKFYRAATCSVGIECEHGRDVCPICDHCTCEAKRTFESLTGGSVTLKPGDWLKPGVQILEIVADPGFRVKTTEGMLTADEAFKMWNNQNAR